MLLDPPLLAIEDTFPVDDAVAQGFIVGEGAPVAAVGEGLFTDGAMVVTTGGLSVIDPCGC